MPVFLPFQPYLELKALQRRAFDSGRTRGRPEAEDRPEDAFAPMLRMMQPDPELEEACGGKADLVKGILESDHAGERNQFFPLIYFS